MSSFTRQFRIHWRHTAGTMHKIRRLILNAQRKTQRNRLVHPSTAAGQRVDQGQASTAQQSNGESSNAFGNPQQSALTYTAFSGNNNTTPFGGNSGVRLVCQHRRLHSELEPHLHHLPLETGTQPKVQQTLRHLKHKILQHPHRVAILVQLPLFSLLLAMARQLLFDLVWLQLLRNQPLRHFEQTRMRIKTQRKKPVDCSPKDDATKMITVNTLTLCQGRKKLTTRRYHHNSVEEVGTIILQIIIIIILCTWCTGGDKNQPCTFFAQGKCRFGANYKFSHDINAATASQDFGGGFNGSTTSGFGSN
jgi:hypothetical protein